MLNDLTVENVNSEKVVGVSFDTPIINKDGEIVDFEHHKVMFTGQFERKSTGIYGYLYKEGKYFRDINIGDLRIFLNGIKKNTKLKNHKLIYGRVKGE